MKRKFSMLLVATAAALALAVPAAAAPPSPPAPVGPTGKCPKGFDKLTVQTVLDTIAAPGFEAAIRAGDYNQDTFICVKILPNVDRFAPFPAFVFIDNVVQPPPPTNS